MEILNIVLNLFKVIPHERSEIYITHNSIVILNNDFDPGVEYLYNCINVDSKYPNLLRK